nr:MAG TPA: Thymidylate synthase [Caudoviricetes sp.]
MKAYLANLDKIINRGDLIENDRSGTGMFSLIGLNEQYSLFNGELPLITTRKINFTKTLSELIWFLKGDSNVQYLKEKQVPFWTKWTSPITQDIGPMYPVLWRRKPEVTSKLYSNGVRKELKYEITQVDQIKRILESIEKHPFSRRHYLSNVAIGLNPEESVSPIENVENGRMALDTCHQVFYLNVRKLHPVEMKKVIEYRKAQSHAFNEVDSRPLPQYRLDSLLQMRSNDVMVGKPHNIAQYSALTFIIAHVLNLHPGHYTHSVNDSHVYLSHHKEALEQLTREPYPLPKLYLSQALTKEVLLKGELSEEMFQLVGYQSHGFIKLSLEG